MSGTESEEKVASDRVSAAALEVIDRAVQKSRLLETARRLIDVPSPTRSAGGVADVLEEILTEDGFEVERAACGWSEAPAVIVRWNVPTPGRILQFDGHLDTVHLPFSPSAVQGDRLTGSGASDMKAGIAAAVEALRVLRDTQLLTAGGILLTAHDLHEAPWGDASQLNEMIRSGYCGDGVLIPEYTCDVLPVVGRGNATLRVSISRPGQPIHEVFRPRDEPDVMLAGAKLVQRFAEWEAELSRQSDPLAGSESVFLGQFHCGEMYNQFASRCCIEGTRRWLPGHSVAEVEAEFHRVVSEVSRETGAAMQSEFGLIRDAFELDLESPLVTAFQGVYRSLTGTELPTAAKPFVDDGSCFWQLRRIPAITHGPRGGGAHTENEWVSISDLTRVAKVYAATAIAFCNESASPPRMSAS